LKLRMDAHAQYEIQQYGKAMAHLIKPYVPLAYEAFEDYRLSAGIPAEK
jgi:thymidylate synthase (FAD)